MPKLVDFEGVGTVEVPDDFRDSELTELYGQLSQGRLSSAGGAFMRAGGEMLGGALSGAARVTQAFPPPTHNPVTGALIPRGPAVPLEEEPIYKFGQDLAGGAREAFPTNPLYADKLETAVASGAGSVVGLLPSALAGPLAPVASGLTYGLSSGEQGAQEASQAIDNQIAEALAKGDEETARRLSESKSGIVNKAFAGYGAAGALSQGALGVAGKIPMLAKMGAKRGVVNSMIRGGGGEALQEGGEQGIQNVTAKVLFDPDRSVAEGVGMSGGAGGIVGAAFGGAAAGVGMRQRKARLDAIRADRAGRVLNPMSPEDAALAPLSASAVKSTAVEAEDFLSKQLTAEDLGLDTGAAPVNPDAAYQPPVATGPVATVATPEEIAQAKTDAGTQAAPGPAATVTAGTPTVTPTPEPPEVIAAQLALTASPESSKAVTLVTPGEDVPPVPDGLQTAETQHGTAIFNPQKTTEQQVEEAAAGDIFDPALLGMGAAVPESDVAVTTHAPDGARNVLSELATEETVQQAMQAQQAAVPGGTTEVVPAGQVLQERGSDTQVVGNDLAGGAPVEIPISIKGEEWLASVRLDWNQVSGKFKINGFKIRNDNTGAYQKEYIRGSSPEFNTQEEAENAGLDFIKAQYEAANPKAKATKLPESVELNELRLTKEKRGLGRLNQERLTELEAKQSAPAAETGAKGKPVEQMTAEEFDSAVRTLNKKTTQEMSPADLEPSKKLIAVLENVKQPPPEMGGLGPNNTTKKMLIDAGYVERAKAKGGRLTEKGRQELDQLKIGIRPLEDELFNAKDEISSSAPVSAAAVDAYGIKLPEGYVREGDLYVFKPAPSLPSEPARVQLRSGPQTYTIEEQLPAQPSDQPGEVYFRVKNEKTGEVQTVESGDLKPVKSKPGATPSAAVEADPVEALLTRAIDATNPQGKAFDFVSGVSHAVANAALKIARAVYIATRDMTAAVRAAVAHMRDNATEGFDEAAAQAKVREMLGEKKASKRNSLRVKLSREALTDLALSQEKWKDWYKEHQDTLDAFFGSDAGLFQKILAITSQAASVKANVGLALKAFAQFKQGLDFDGKTRGEESSGYLPAVIGNLNALRAETQIQGRKIGAYTSANEGKTDSVVVDRHIARMLFGVDTPSAAQYAKASKVLTEIANELGWEPRQVQAALWAASIVKSGKEPQSYGQYLRTLHSRGTLKERIGHVVERSSEVHGDGGLGVADSGGVQAADGGIRYSGVTPTSSVAEVVAAINKGDTNTALRAVNQVVDEAKKLRDRVKAEIERRTQPRRTGKGAILDQIVRAANSGRISTKARDAILSFLAGIPEAKLADTAISIRRGESAPNYDFAENLVSLFLGSPSVAAVGAERTATHEFWHGLSRFLPQEEVDAMERDYKKALAEHIKKNPGFLALVGRYTLTPQQYAEYEKFASKEDLARLTPIRGSDGEITGYKIGFTPENYRFVMLDEWIAEKMSDLVEGKQSAPNTFLGKLAKIFKEFLATIKAKLGLDQYEKFYQSTMSDDARIPERYAGVKDPEQIYNPENGQRGDVVYSDVQPPAAAPGARTQESRGQFTGLITRDGAKQWSEAAAGWISQFNGDLNAATVAAIGGELPSDVRQFVFGQLLELTNQAIATTKNPIENGQLLRLQERQSEAFKDSGALGGKTLAARFLAMKQIEHIMPVLLYRGLVRKAQLQAIPFTSVTSDAVRSWLTQAGRQAVAETREAMTKANAVVARVLKQQVSDYGQTWRDIVTASTEAQGNHRAEIFKRIAAHPALQGLDQASQIELTNLLSDAWERERMKIFRSEFRKMVPLPKKTKEVDAKKLLDAIPDLVKQANLGLLDDAQFRDALAKRYGVASVNDATARRLNEMAQQAQKAPSGVMRSRILSQMVDLIQIAGGISKAHVLRDYWYAAVLSSPRTQVDNGMALLNGALMTALASARDPQAAPFVWRAFTSGLAEAGRDFLPILQGERWRMANIDIDRPASVLDTLQKSPNYAAKAIGSMAYVGRMIAALDHLNTLATREAMLAWAIHRSTDGDAREMMRPGPADIAAARERAIQEGTPAGLVQKRTREILEERISPELLLSATTIGQEAAYQSEPYGFLGYFYRAIKGLDKLPYVGGVSRILSGTAFARYAVNASNDMLNYVAPISLFRWYVSATERQATSKLNFTPEQRDLILMKAALGTVAATAAAAAFLGGGDDDKKKRAIDIQGSFRSLEGSKRNQLLAEGNIPYSIRIGDTYVSYRQLPVAAILGTIGEMRDRQKYQPDQWKEESVAANIGNGAIAGMFLVRDSAAISSFMDFLGVANAYKYDVKGISEKSVPKYAAKMLGSLVPNAVKDVEAWTDPSLYRGNSASEYFLQQLPLARQLAGEGPMLNLFGEPVKADKYPWSRWVSAREVSPEWEAAGNLAARGLFLPQVAGFSVTNDDGTRRKATPRELYAYQREVGAGYKQFIRENASELLSMDPKEAADFINKETTAIRKGVRSDIQP